MQDVQMQSLLPPEESKLRKELALCYRVCAREKLNEGTDNHLSVMLDNDQNTFLTLPYGILWSTVQPEDFVLVDPSGKIVRKSKRKGFEDAQPDISAIKIHGNIHLALGAKGKAVFHNH